MHLLFLLRRWRGEPAHAWKNHTQTSQGFGHRGHGARTQRTRSRQAVWLCELWLDLSVLCGKQNLREKCDECALAAGLLLAWVLPVCASAAEPLPGTAPLVGEQDLSVEMRAGFRRFFQGQIDDSPRTRATHWRRDVSSREAYERSIEPNRQRLRKKIGLVDERLRFDAPELVADLGRSSLLADLPSYAIHAIRWLVFEGVWGEGLLLEPKRRVLARIVALPDADQTPEMIAGLAPGVAAESRFAARLASAGCQVIVPVLINRSDEFSGNPDVVMTNQTHREWVNRQAYQMGRHLIGYEVQKILAAVDWFERSNRDVDTPIGVAGYGEGGLLAFYGGAADPRIDAVLVSGYFDSRQGLADEPNYRGVLGLLVEFGDAEIASLIAPRALIVEHSSLPTIAGPPGVRDGRRNAAAPGRIETPPFARVRRETERLKAFFPTSSGVQSTLNLVGGVQGEPVAFGSEPALREFLRALKIPGKIDPAAGAGAPPPASQTALTERQRRQVAQLTEYNQMLMRRSAGVREKYWAAAKPESAATWPAATAKYRDAMWEDLIGRYPMPSIPPNARTRRIAETPAFIVYEVLLDVTPEVFAWGHLLLPRNLRPGEKRPVVVCQHGLEGVPADTITDDPASKAFPIYQAFSARLAERGFIVYAPHNFYRGGNEFRQLQRLAHTVGKTLFAATTLQHAQMLNWLSALEFVDSKRIGFYGLSYGGNTAMRVPALLEQYAAVICSGDFNEWVFKNVTNEHPHSFAFGHAYEVFEFNLGHTFNHAEMAALIAPRPFMVERGHDDGVARDEWVAAEYAKVRRLYAKLGIPERTTIEFFNGPHRINGVGSYEFLHRHLNWPAPER